MTTTKNVPPLHKNSQGKTLTADDSYKKFYKLNSYAMLVIANYLDMLLKELGDDVENDEDYVYFARHFDILIRGTSGEDVDELMKEVQTH